MNSKEKKINRQEFLRLSFTAVGMGIVGYLYGNKDSKGGVYPPGAESKFLFGTLCSRCGLCAQVCDQKAIEIDINGKPIIRGSNGFCDFCNLCVDVCPTNALSPYNPETEKLGLAVINQDRCIAWNWPGCRLCYEKCLEIREAIWIDEDLRPYVDNEICNGCGACVTVCPQSAKQNEPRSKGKAVVLVSNKW
ncbi:MAG: 4Fe-4S dicluster domain-containing protein [Chloroflexi bacterium]|jgi:ferredoxin-type protein NapG|nr:4Fe-4S dicluster domain-containing protein [Chloroflexota bacterium]MBT3670385.1 4Fe-4S dicluster domain-containing protein [Chloroflexota bacterium]MBT4002040.1 4Fe-4S dicluster domain-containing protein [Chloroflexota bacterium]MBT4305572.1 4Fe-4S dicluster domain-containing protein [Chloroflexota bacterium]MBT4533184.1 4Fe-4S dicluster domain-containing protein [Chloroflexota bacterium]